jgi:hypothetical protein
MEARLDNHKESLALRAFVGGLSVLLSLVALTLLGIACAWTVVLLTGVGG